ncbi:exonuclease domain-containing protein [Candidatus Phytoplasma pini]|uniref:DNA polymerase III PolC-type n=1 Tax=Candidatus Phytoplasma pini TaxID=267362 RepID=A0A559KJG7_9MOLU|nr:exonuclease domain-containing protein [Candidatus Phytoplasma pini]TVY12238.1 DNA polymerase III polC-type [Candidatus Phytoplasma pini]
MFLDQFDFFKKELQKSFCNDFELEVVKVYIKNNLWVLYICSKVKFENLEKLKFFRDKLKYFLLEKTNTLIKNLNLDFVFLGELKELGELLKKEEKSANYYDSEKNILNEELKRDKNISSQNSEKNSLNQNNNNISLKEVTFDEIPFSISEIGDFKKNNNLFKIKGFVQGVSFKTTQNNSILFSFYLLEPEKKQDSIEYRVFLDKQKFQQVKKDLQTGRLVQILSSIFISKDKTYYYLTFDTKKLSSDNNIYKILNNVPLNFLRMDDYLPEDQRRIEFHVHTKMSNLDATTSAKDYIEIAEKWKHKAIAFTDYNGIYEYPEINKSIQGKKIKPILGIEVDFVEDKKPVFVTNQSIDNNIFESENFFLKNHNYVVFDLETTGLSPKRDQIIEISAIKIENGKIVNNKIFEQLINPKRTINQKITELTGIKNEDIVDKPTIDQILPEFLKFIEGYVLIAHNISFDIGFLESKIQELNLYFKIPFFIDTLTLAQKYFHEKIKFFSLKRIAKALKIKEDYDGEYHRSLFDARITALIFIKMLDELEEKNILRFHDLKDPLSEKFVRSYNVNILVQNQVGYHNLFRLLSDALTKDFYKKPRFLESNFEKYRQGLLLGSGGFEGKVFETALYFEDKLSEVISIYDYIEVQPISTYKHIICDLGSYEENKQIIDGTKIIQETILKIIKEARKQNKIVIATGDVHYLHPYENIYREIYINAKLVGGGLHKLSRYDSENLPDNYFLTTQEMLDSFSFIEDEKIIKDIVITNTHLLNNKIEQINMFPKELLSLPDDSFADNLKVPSIRKELKFLIQKRIEQIYGKILHPFVRQRVEKELKSIIGNNDENTKNNQVISPIYYLTYLLVQKSLHNQYPVGSRGSIGSSLIATILEITEVNPLKPHFRCKKCHYTVFDLTPEQKKDSEYQKYMKIYIDNYQTKDENNYDILNNILSGYDLPDMNCPFCLEKFYKDGQNIPFETFLGLEGNKTPDIDLNFAGDYQSKAHDYIKELLGEEHVFRAGTIQTVAKQNAYGYVKGFIENKKIKNKIRSPFEINRRSIMIEGVKRSTGQHPGGIIVVPKKHSIYEVTPIQFPANDTTSSWKTTHFDYHSFESNLFKIDILGHDDPILIKFFMDYASQKPETFNFKRYQDIPIDDPKIYELFSGELKLNEDKTAITTLAIPEFGTLFVQNLLKTIYRKTRKTFTFADLVKISGFSHGTDVWVSNALDILNQEGDFRNYNISFDDVIGCRDDIMTYLINKNVKASLAFEIMEFVRKGKQHEDENKKTWESLINDCRTVVPEWYFKSAFKIKYLFPKAHAVAYVLMAVRIAWFKVHHPLLFYSGFFSQRVEHFDYSLMLKNINEINIKIQKFKTRKDNLSVKERGLMNTLENIVEMQKRGICFLPIDLNSSDKNEFLIIEEEKALRIPFIVIDGLGEVAANKILEARKEKLFTQKDFAERVKINKTIMGKFKEEFNLIDNLPFE